MNYPSDHEIEQLHHKYAPDQAAFDIIYTHCKIVWEIAAELIHAKNLQVDEDLVRAGCQLHDIGVYQLFKPDGAFYEPVLYTLHGLFGQEIVEAEGLGAVLGDVITRHIGAGITKEDIVKNGLPLPHTDFIPISVEEQLVSYADNFHTKDIPALFCTYESIKVHQDKYGQDSVDRLENMRDTFGEPDIIALAAKYRQAIRA